MCLFLLFWCSLFYQVHILIRLPFLKLSSFSETHLPLRSIGSVLIAMVRRKLPEYYERRMNETLGVRNLSADTRHSVVYRQNALDFI
jgi:hypothetical protein